MPFKRTAHCKRCGEVLFKIEPGIGDVTYNCIACGEKVAVVECNEYETLQHSCDKCGSDVFKVKVTVDDHSNSQEYWIAECESCKATPDSIYVDNEGNIISEEERDQLIKQDELYRLEEEAYAKDDLIHQLEEEVDNLNSEIEEKDRYISSLKSEIEDTENEIYNLKKQAKDKDKYIVELRERVAQLELDIRI